LGGPSHRPVPYQKPRWVGDGGVVELLI
jgi:hypothetical protein